MIPSFATAGVLIAPPAALVLSGYVPGNPLAAQHYNYMWAHLTLELNNLLTAGGVVQNAAVDNQVATAVQNVTQIALAIMNCVRVTTGSAMTVPIGSGTIITALGSGSTYTVTLPDAHSALVAGFEVDVQNHNAGATNMLGSGYGSVLVKLLNVNDGLAGYTNGTWQITEQYGHLRARPAVSGNPSGYGWIVESCSGSVYRSVVTSTQTASTAINTWTNQGGSLTVGPGVYRESYKGNALDSTGGSNLSVTLSTGAATETDQDMTIQMASPSAGAPFGVAVMKPVILIGALTTFYLNIRNNVGTHTIGFMAGTAVGNTIISFERIA